MDMNKYMNDKAVRSKRMILPICLFVLLPFFSACSDFFDQDSSQVIYADKGHLGNATDTVYSVIGIMNKLQSIADRTILLGEVRGDLIDVTANASADLHELAMFNVSDDNIYNSPRDYYSIINNCNYFLAKADTTLKNNRNEFIFKKEYAAVKAFRAWVYLQLVLNYGEVPFVVEPILTKAEADMDYPVKDIKGVCEYFINDLAPFVNSLFPSYGDIRGLPSKLFYFPIYVLLGDLNLWAGNYKEAALNYYKYLSTRNGTNSAYPTSTNSVMWGTFDTHWNSRSDSWSTNSFLTESAATNSELISLIPGDSIPSEGNYSQLRNLFNSNENNQYKVSLIPSQRIVELSAAQKYCHLTRVGDVIYAPDNLTDNESGDLRLSSVWTTSQNVRYKNRIISDYSTLDKYYSSVRNVHIYRRTMVYLRMAEALNRAGYPRFAFAILKNGVNDRNIESDIIPYYTADSTWIRQFKFPVLDYVLQTPARLGSENTMGIHSRGSGYSPYNEYYVLPDDTTITDSLARIAYQVEGVENMIVDEEALEFAFEGVRFYDLMRVALRRNNPSYLADRIYQRRGKDRVAEVKAEIGRDLTDTKNWFLRWNNKIGLGNK
jgi:hypothetical protein